MKTQCVMCGRDIAQGILCEKCDRPKRTSTKSAGAPAAALNVQEELAAEPRHAPPAPQPPPPDEDPFPKAPLLPFPRESTTLALTSMMEVLVAAEVPSILLAADRVVKFVSPTAQALLGIASSANLAQIENALGFSVPDSAQTFKLNISIGARNAAVSIIPLSGGAGGHVVLLKPDEAESSDSALMTFIREAVITPLGALQAALAAAAMRKKDPLLQDATNTIDQIFSSLELAPGNDIAPPKSATRAVPIATILQHVVEQVSGLAEIKGVKLQIDSPATNETFAHGAQLGEALGYLIENAIHYVPDGGQVVVGLRFLEHKGSPLLLFFVMDNGPAVPEELRLKIFESGFVWSPDGDRSGKNLAQARDFATSHGGQIWVEAKSGKACTFFLRIRPDQS